MTIKEKIMEIWWRTPEENAFVGKLADLIEELNLYESFNGDQWVKETIAHRIEELEEL